MTLRMHGRVQAVQQAGVDLSEAVARIVERHRLTYAELFGILGAEVSSWAKYAVREERHGDADKPGGVE